MTRLLDALNSAQDDFRFHRAEAPVPVRLFSTATRVRAWALKKGLRLDESESLDDNMVADHFYPVAQQTMERLDLDFIVGLTPQMVAFSEDGALKVNYFAISSKRRMSLVSTHHVTTYAERSGRPFEAFLMCIVVGELLDALHDGKLTHEEDRRCLFDFNNERDSIVESLREPAIEVECLERIEPSLRLSADSMVAVLRKYRRHSSEGVVP